MKKLLPSSLMVRFVSAFLILILVVGSLSVYLGFKHARQTLKDTLFERLRTVTVTKENELERWLEQQRQNVKLLSTLPEIQARSEIFLTETPVYGPSQSAYMDLFRVLSMAKTVGYTDLEEIFILDNDSGKIVLSTTPEHEGKYHGDAEYYLQDNHDTVTEHIYTSVMTRQPAITIATPLYDHRGRQIGVFAAHLNLAHLEYIMHAGSGLGANGEVYLVDHDNSFISTHPRKGREFFPDGVHTPGIDLALAGLSDVGLYQNYAGQTVIGAYRFLARHNLALIAEVPENEAFAPARQLAYTLFLISMGASAVLMLGVYLLVRQIARPIQALVATTRAIEEGDLVRQVNMTGLREFDELAANFNNMTAQLRQMMEHLENIIIDRTEELEILNLQLEQDIQVRQETEKALQEKNEALVLLNQEKNEFLGIAAHDLKNPLSAIKSLAAEIRDSKGLPANVQQYSDTIHSSARKMFDLITNLLDVNAIESGETRLHVTCVNAVPLLAQALADFAEAARRKHIELRFTPPDNPLYVWVDEGTARQILDNLLSNALKYTAPGKTVTVALSRGEVRVQVAIRDQGPGLSAADQAKLFGKFTRLTPQPTSGEHSTGLGLFIVKKLSEAMDCTVWCESEVGRGSVFYLGLPAADVTDTTELPPTVPEIPDNMPLPSDLSILLAEDNSVNRMVAQLELKKLGLHAGEAGTGLEVLEALRRQPYEVILMDIQMPEMDGLEATRRALAEFSAKPPWIIAMTASDSPMDRDKCKEAGMHDYIGKPFTQHDLHTVLGRYVAQRRLAVS